MRKKTEKELVKGKKLQIEWTVFGGVRNIETERIRERYIISEKMFTNIKSLLDNLGLKQNINSTRRILPPVTDCLHSLK